MAQTDTQALRLLVQDHIVLECVGPEPQYSTVTALVLRYSRRASSPVEQEVSALEKRLGYQKNNRH